MRVLSRFLAAATDAAHFPAPSLPEIAFLGRSNVGKSSVINSLVGDKVDVSLEVNKEYRSRITDRSTATRKT